MRCRRNFVIIRCVNDPVKVAGPKKPGKTGHLPDRATLLTGFLFFLLLVCAADRRDFAVDELTLVNMNKGSLAELREQLAKEPVAPLAVALLVRLGVSFAGPSEAGCRLFFLLLSAAALAHLVPFARGATGHPAGRAAILAAGALVALRAPAWSSATAFPLVALAGHALFARLHARLLRRAGRADLTLLLLFLLVTMQTPDGPPPTPLPAPEPLHALLLPLLPAAFLAGPGVRRLRVFGPLGCVCLLLGAALQFGPDLRPPLSALPGELAARGFAGTVYATDRATPLLAHALKDAPLRLAPLPAEQDLPRHPWPDRFALAALAADFEGDLAPELRASLAEAVARRRPTLFFRAVGGDTAPALALFEPASRDGESFADPAGLFTANRSGRDHFQPAMAQFQGTATLCAVLSLLSLAFRRGREPEPQSEPPASAAAPPEADQR